MPKQEFHKVYTCTPVAFHADARFFTRDTGLVSRTLRGLGYESKTIMPLPWHADDEKEHIIRVAPAALRSVKWWRKQGIDALVLYSWGDPRYTLIARAIHKAGVKLILQLDFNGHFLKAEKFPRFLREYAVNFLRARHLSYADAIAASPVAKVYLQGHPRYGHSIADKCHTMPTAVDSRFAYAGAPKERRVICVGDWEAAVKRPAFMRETIQLLLEQDAGVKVDICGPFGAACAAWWQALPPQQRERTHLLGAVSHAELPALYNRAQVSLCTSESEGTHGVSAEALCCGCSVVTTNRERLRMVHWYTTRDSGTISADDTPASLCDAILNELYAWLCHRRDPHGIAASWQPVFHTEQTLPRILHAIKG
ncbi:MAG: glycosyltransferase family 4 protein [Akkermansia sp.]|nr:glycosyltransferase family 4 protein [Akkermansia sp.]